jgi:hypothetical protein
MTARRAPTAPHAAARGLVDDGRILRLGIEARSALRLRISDGHRSNNKDGGGQSHGDFTHQILLPSVALCCGLGGDDRRTETLVAGPA